MEFGNYSRKDLEKLADLGIFPSQLGVGDEGDTSEPYLKKGTDVDDDGIMAVYDQLGMEEK